MIASSVQSGQLGKVGNRLIVEGGCRFAFFLAGFLVRFFLFGFSFLLRFLFRLFFGFLLRFFLRFFLRLFLRLLFLIFRGITCFGRRLCFLRFFPGLRLFCFLWLSALHGRSLLRPGFGCFRRCGFRRRLFFRYFRLCFTHAVPPLCLSSKQTCDAAEAVHEIG